MLSFLPPPVLGAVVVVLMVLNTVAWGIPLYAGILIKVLVPAESFRRRWTGWLLDLTAGWTRCNGLIYRLAPPIRFEMSGFEGLRQDGSYLVVANHQSWSDIVLMQHLFTGRIPYLRFFSKRELLKLPIIGGALWGLDFPLMHRHSTKAMTRNPALRTDDLEATRAACERYRGRPVSIVIFLEGTRCTADKHAAQKSPYRNLLRPRAGGLAFSIDSMGDQFDTLLDVTIVYPEGNSGFKDLVCGRLRHVVFDVRPRPIPPDLLGRDYLSDPRYRRQMQNWLTGIWEDKDQHIDQARDRFRN